MVSALDADSPVTVVFGTIFVLALGVGLLVLVLFVGSRLRGWREQRHWMSHFAAGASGRFHPESGKSSPGFGVDPGSLERPIAEASVVRSVEFRYRDHDVIGVEYRDAHHWPGADHGTTAMFHSVQVRVPDSAALFLASGGAFPARVMRDFEQVKTFDKVFDGAVKVRAVDRERTAELLDPELRAWIVAEPRFGRWPVFVERGTIRTGGGRQLDQVTLLAEADFLIDVAGRLPRELWTPGSWPDRV